MLARFALLASATASVVAQSTWFQPTLAINPPARDTHELATEPVSGTVLLFGGVLSPNAGQLNDTWEWNGQGWTQVQPTTAPAARETFAIAADGQGGVLLFGGFTFFVGVRNDTWRFSQGQWQQLQPATSPSPRRGQHMVLTQQGILLFGGSNASTTTFYGDTWEWTGGTWNQLSPQNSPSPRRGYGMAYDSLRNRVVLFGGFGQSLVVFADTWEWSGSNWIMQAPSQSPPARGYAPMVYDPNIQKTVLYDGIGIGDCWTWDGSSWTQVVLDPVNPGARGSPITYSPLSQGIITFSGHSSADTWLTAPAVPAQFNTFGIGCPGSGGTPTLAAAGSDLPRVGHAFDMNLGNLPSIATVVVGVLGFSTTFNSSPLGSYALPRDLGSIGMPGCTQYVSDDGTFFLLALTGQVTWPIGIPANAQLAGLAFHVQGAVFDPQANALGATVTNAGTGQIGF